MRQIGKINYIAVWEFGNNKVEILLLFYTKKKDT